MRSRLLALVVVVFASLLVPLAPPAASLQLNRPVMGMAATPSGDGYWLVASDGGLFTFGDAPFLGSMGAVRLNSPIVGMAATPSGAGYWMVAADGGIFSFGDASFLGSMGAVRLNSPIVGMAATASGRGYWMVAADGGIFTFGDATFLGSMGAVRLNSPVVGMAASPGGGGYWLVARDGGIFTFGDAGFLGSAGGIRLNEPVVGMAPSRTGGGYWLVATDGGIFTYGDAGFRGSPQEGGGPAPAPGPSGPPTLAVTTLVSGLVIPWDLAFAPDGAMVFTERPGRLRVRLADGTLRTLADVSGSINADGERGLLGMVLDPGFASNRTLYTCQSNRTPAEVRVVKWTVDPGWTSATPVADPFVGGMPSTATNHNGCRPRFGADGFLYVGTGDSSTGTVPQSDASRGGKVLRVDPATGAVSIFTKGHRNVQGLALRPDGSGQLFAVEHGPDRDDEIHLLRAGGNSGWDPVPGYNQSVPMTDTAKFPGAMRPVWSSGAPTLATSGATFVTGSSWGSWNGALVVACLKASRLQVFSLDAAGNVTSTVAALTNQFGRLRTPVQGPDGALYVTTSNGSNDRILRVAPS